MIDIDPVKTLMNRLNPFSIGLLASMLVVSIGCSQEATPDAASDANTESASQKTIESSAKNAGRRTPSDPLSAGGNTQHRLELTKQLAERAAESAREYPAELLEAGRKGTEILIASGIVDQALNVGDQMPEFELPDVNGELVSSSQLLEKGPLVLTFYRGAWCPYCNIYLAGLQKRMDDFQAANATVVAISIEPPDRSLTVSERHAIRFTVLSDPSLQLARKFGIVYEMPKVTNDAILDFGFDIAEYNGTEKVELPLSTTYIVDTNGEITYAFVKADYKLRADPDVILAELAEM